MYVWKDGYVSLVDFHSFIGLFIFSSQFFCDIKQICQICRSLMFFFSQ